MQQQGLRLRFPIAQRYGSALGLGDGPGLQFLADGRQVLAGGALGNFQAQRNLLGRYALYQAPQDLELPAGWRLQAGA